MISVNILYFLFYRNSERIENDIRSFAIPFNLSTKRVLAKIFGLLLFFFQFQSRLT